MSDKTIFGIDLGTTYSAIAYVDQYQRPTVIPNAEGDLTTPSVVQFDNEERIVGKEARNSAALYPDATVSMIKRQMGNANYRFHYNGQDYSPQEISSYILKRLAQDAEAFSGIAVKDVVITCPAYFGITEREATAEAGQLAGFNVLSIINEPTAAAIAYGVHNTNDQTVLVYDLGGGTFDVTIINIQNGDIVVIATDGDHFLGGRNWDELVVNFLAEAWQREVGSSDDPLSSLETLEDLFLKAQEAKHTLTQREKTDVRVIHEGQTARIPLTRQQFDQLTQPLLNRTIELTKQVLEVGAQKGFSKIDQVLLVGGSSRMPQVMQALKPLFEVEPKLYEPDLAVAKGAAIYGQKLALDQEIRIRIAAKLGTDAEAVDTQKVPAAVLEAAQVDVARESGLQLDAVKALSTQVIQNVASRSFGIVAWDPKQGRDVVSNLIKRNQAVPAQSIKRYGTKSANQNSVLIRIVENLSDESIAELSNSRQIGEAELMLPPGLPAEAPIEVTYRLDEQGRLHIRARDVTNERDVTVVVDTVGGLSEQERQAAANRSRDLIIT